MKAEKLTPEMLRAKYKSCYRLPASKFVATVERALYLEAVAGHIRAYEHIRTEKGGEEIVQITL